LEWELKRRREAIYVCLSVLIVASVAFALYITCPRMTAMIATETKISDLNPFLMISLGCLFGIPLFIMLFCILQHFGVEATVLSAAALDVEAALLVGKLDIKTGIELMVITVFVYAGIRVAPLIANLITSS
jgi:hypothetical protein